ncbi:patatin-like phospholipase family protein [Flavobacterium gelatinilyticum]|uniref:patatin-like phospholipase family protein n=1 Tax=Flavobacterium gelatinilyticum TaxID=3003260 RepID=UPI002481098B|nr:patatin-like phospholipase family protein [Flavobacterium gelatinilyticum]
MEEKEQAIIPLSADSDYFEIGLVMAGAVSAGAYTAGVIDYLLQALDEWEKAKAENSTEVSHHKVRIKVMTGASAGGMVCAITAAELIRREKEKALDYKESLLYKAWVEEIDIKPLLTTSDLDGEKAIKSMLNSDVLDTIADTIINPEGIEFIDLPHYIAPELKMYLTLTNLRGLPYEFKVTGESGLPYGMDDHADYQYFELCKATRVEDWRKLRVAAVATGAFPVGLKARLIERDTTEYKERIEKNGRDISGKLKLDTKTGIAYPFVAVDGGVLNNEPIELATSVWASKDEPQATIVDCVNNIKGIRIQNKDNLKPGKNALIIIDPFPNFASNNEAATIHDTDLANVILPLISAMRSQNLFKPEELVMAADECNYTRYLIAPVRRNDRGAIAENALACGFFGGFGGFLSKEFREHDYHLGRRNAQRFLEEYFALPKEYFVHNPDVIIKKLGKVTEENIEKNIEKLYSPIIPILKNAPPEVKVPWPSYSEAQLSVLKDQMRERISKLTIRIPVIGVFGKTWVKITMFILLLTIIIAECIKWCKVRFDEWFVLFSAFYLLIFQIVLGFVLITMFCLFVSKSILDKRLTKKAGSYIRYLLLEWGIDVKTR